MLQVGPDGTLTTAIGDATGHGARAGTMVTVIKSLFSAYPIPTYTPGYLAILETPEGGLMSVNYATTNFQMEEHTGAAVPVYANTGGRGIVPSYLRQPELFKIMRDYLRL